MNKRTKMLVINYIMAVSLIVVMTTGVLLKPFPGMWMGIAHSLSGVTLTVSVIIHCLQHRRKRRRE